MSQKSNIRVIIPALNEQNAVGKVIADLPHSLISEVIVVDNGSIDNTPEVAADSGATVLKEMQRGYGSACLCGIKYINELEEDTDIVVFIDADYSDYPGQLTEVVSPIINEDYELVIGSRNLGVREKGSMTIPQVFGNWLATRLLKLIYKVHFTDLGPFRAITLNSLNAIDMKDENYGWTVEMQLKAAKHQLKSTEIPVNYKNRIGTSKISGTIKGTFLAGYKIIWTILKYA
jgi:glycosyltransferase involved in cell wall biosynthesis